ncbi:hypothetical protein QBZ16_004487 [Prototheca wickerhamii]|uniref:SCP domain-containing protein n=1 Tax=Prototheca wickerhamii TaxID=3111 RepID=A0AAD9MMV3_PROWI|nr:hypothetical protein QBZ16_004487 [Prototheca wickerhamii]
MSIAVVTATPFSSRRLLSGGEACPDGDALLAQINAARATHGASPLTWNPSIAATAAAEAATCSGQHTANGPYGQNILMAFGPISSGGCAMAFQYWYTNEQGVYNYNAPGWQPSAGHFTQLVWKSTTQMGCGVAQCPGSSWYGGPIASPWHFVVCDFNPPGNGDGAFAANVSPYQDVSSPPSHRLPLPPAHRLSSPAQPTRRLSSSAHLPPRKRRSPPPPSPASQQPTTFPAQAPQPSAAKPASQQPTTLTAQASQPATEPLSQQSTPFAAQA